MKPVIPSGEDEVEEVTDDDDEDEEDGGGGGGEERDSPDTRQEVVTEFNVIPSIRTDGAFGGSAARMKRTKKRGTDNRKREGESGKKRKFRQQTSIQTGEINRKDVSLNMNQYQIEEKR